MKATIWHNPRCSKSRAALAILNDAGADITIVAYLEDPPSRTEIARMVGRAGLAPRDALRVDSTKPSDATAALDLMARDPATIERPLVETERGVRLCRPPELVLEIL